MNVGFVELVKRNKILIDMFIMMINDNLNMDNNVQFYLRIYL